MLRTLLNLLLLMIAASAAAQDTGVWYDRTRSGHGLDLQQQGNTVFSPLFTFDQNNEPVWYWFQGERVGDLLEADLVRFRYVPGAQPPVALDATVGRITLRFNASSCADGLARPGAPSLAGFAFNIGAERSAWCMEPLISPSAAAESALSGNYFVASETGWGVQAHFYTQNNALQTFQTLYFYDANQQPRWLVGSNIAVGTQTELALSAIRGYCRSCPSVPLQSVPAGTLRLSLVTPLAGTSHNRIESVVRYPFGAGGQWNRNAVLSPLSAAKYPDASVVATKEGLVRGTSSDGVVAFRNLPFAAPPLAALRWRAPQPALPRPFVRDAQRAGAACPQDDVGDGAFGALNDPKSEDCLQLNIWTQQVRSNVLKPVMFWLHGGGLTQGSAVTRTNSGGLPRYDGVALAKQDVVLVSINYRLGPLGYLVLPDLIGEFADQPGAGNYGLLDQIQALAWVRDNIAQFGGDPDQVTIFGESAGGLSVCALMASPRARGLFHRAIMQSGGCARNLPALLQSNGANQPAAVEQGARFSAAAGCQAAIDRKACLRALTWQQVIALGAPAVGLGRLGETYGLSIDGYALTEAPGAAFRAGRQAAVPFVVGVNDDEHTTLFPDSFKPRSVPAYEAEVRRLFPSISSQVLQVYPASNYAEPWLALADIYDELRFNCPAQQIAREHAATGSPTYNYYFTYVSPRASLQSFGAFHGGEIIFLFGPNAVYSAGEAPLASDLQRYWSNFARSAVPGISSSGFQWPRYRAENQVGLEISNAGPRLMRDYRQSYCNFWRQYVVF